LGDSGNQLRKGVFYSPSKFLAREKPIKILNRVPICIEAENEVDLEHYLKAGTFYFFKGL